MSKRAVIVVDIGICEQLGQQLQDHRDRACKAFCVTAFAG